MVRSFKAISHGPPVLTLLLARYIAAASSAEDAYRCLRWPSVLLQRPHWHQSVRQASEFLDEDIDPPAEPAEQVAVDGLMDSSLLEKQLSTPKTATEEILPQMLVQSSGREDARSDQMPGCAGCEPGRRSARCPRCGSSRLIKPLSDTGIVLDNLHVGQIVQKELGASNAKMRKWFSGALANLTAKISAITSKQAVTSGSPKNDTIATPCYWPAPITWFPRPVQMQPAAAAAALPQEQVAIAASAVGMAAQQLQAPQPQMLPNVRFAMPVSTGTALQPNVAAWPPQQRAFPVAQAVQARPPLVQQFAPLIRWR
mmetsp:Transcript_117081/g.213028  ORF Transcript_117081/g.213028 Transcript_117081/m.213028 type:complete len:313 (+) Transcript_117081:104-1042(+)